MFGNLGSVLIFINVLKIMQLKSVNNNHEQEFVIIILCVALILVSSTICPANLNPTKKTHTIA